jgi:hypothetical protein
MGQSASTSSKGISRETLLRGTESNRDIINKLFKRFLDTLTPEELLELSNPAACNKYVFVMASALQRTFSELKIRPTKDRSGVLLFQKADSLTKKDTQDEDFRRNCLEVSYFYIRIFQIFGALALTVVDSPGASHIAAAYEGPGVDRAQALGTVGAKGVLLSGGAIGVRTPYSYGQQRLQEVQQLQSRKNAYSILKENGYFLQSPDNVFYPFKEYPNTMAFKYQPGRGSSLLFMAVGRIIEAEIILKSNGIFVLRGFTVTEYDDTGAQKRRTIAYLQQAIKIVYQKQGASLLIDISKNQEVDRSFHDILVLAYRLSKTPDSQEIKDQLRQIIEAGNKNETYLTTEIRAGPGMAEGQRIAQIPVQVPGVAKAGIQTRSNVGSVSGLQTGYLRDILSGIRGKPVALCVARALQLLDTNVITSFPKTLQSGICKTSFDSMPNAIPVPGRTLDTYRPVFAVDQLYHTKKVIKRDATSGVIKTDVQVEDQNAHKDFIQQMMNWFGKPSGVAVSSAPLSSVTIANQYCDNTSMVGKTLQISNPEAIKKILGQVGQLYTYQLAHTKKVMDFLGRFLIQFRKAPGGGMVVSLHPGLLVGGIAQLEKISVEARKLLVGYYQNCEMLYKVAAEIAKVNGQAI